MPHDTHGQDATARTNTRDTRPAVRVGERRMSYEMQPCGRDGRPINGGNHYANAGTIEDAREYAARVVGKPYGGTGPWVAGVEIIGRMVEFYGPAWRAVTGPGAQWHHEVVKSATAAPLTATDQRMACYDTTVMDYFETVHERRSNGSCKCGKYPATV